MAVSFSRSDIMQLIQAKFNASEWSIDSDGRSLSGFSIEVLLDYESQIVAPLMALAQAANLRNFDWRVYNRYAYEVHDSINAWHARNPFDAKK